MDSARGSRESRPVPMADETRPAAWMRSFRLSGFAFFVLAIIVAAIVVLAPSLKQLVQQRQQIASLQQQLTKAKQQVSSTTDDIARWSDPAYIESQARGRLFYVMPGDTQYIVTGTQQASLDDGQSISSKIQKTRVDWVRTLLGSVFTAGLTQKTAAQLQSPQQASTESPTQSSTQGSTPDPSASGG